MSDLVGNPEDWFSHNKAHLYLYQLCNQKNFLDPYSLNDIWLNVLFIIAYGRMIYLKYFSVTIPNWQNKSVEVSRNDLSRDMRKPTFCICENKESDQLRGNREADQRLCFRYMDSAIPLLSKSEISSL